MRFATLALLLVVACKTPSADESAKDEEIAALKTRVERLEKRLNALEAGKGRTKAPAARGAGGGGGGRTRAKAPTPREPVTGPVVPVSIGGDATRVLLTDGDRKWRLPSRVPPGEYTLLAAFGEEKLERRSKVYIKEGEPVALTCRAETNSCGLD